MSDEDAYMALVTSNAQGELNALERDFHALGATEKGSKNGKSVMKGYGRPRRRRIGSMARPSACAHARHDHLLVSCSEDFCGGFSITSDARLEGARGTMRLRLGTDGAVPVSPGCPSSVALAVGCRRRS